MALQRLNREIEGLVKAGFTHDRDEALDCIFICSMSSCAGLMKNKEKLEFADLIREVEDLLMVAKLVTQRDIPSCHHEGISCRCREYIKTIKPALPEMIEEVDAYLSCDTRQEDACWCCSKLEQYSLILNTRTQKDD